MLFSTLLIAANLLVGSVENSPAAGNTPIDSTSAIYDVVFGGADTDCPIYVANRTNTYFGDSKRSPSEFAKLLSMNLATARAFFDANKIQQALQWKPTNAAIHFWQITQDEDEAGMRQTLDKLRRENSCIHYLYSVSAPGISKKGGDAMMMVHRFCGPVCGDGEDAVHLHRVTGIWKIVDWRMLSIN